MRPLPRLRAAAVAGLFAAGFVAAYLAVPSDPYVGGPEGLQLRPEPVALPAALLLGPAAVVGTAAGVLVHNLAFRLVPGGITLLFGVVQTGVVVGAGFLALAVRRRVPDPYRNLAATWALSLPLILVLGAVAAAEYRTAFLEEADHILREVLLPINVGGLVLLEAADRIVPGGGAPPGRGAGRRRDRGEGDPGLRRGPQDDGAEGRGPAARSATRRDGRLAVPWTAVLLLALFVALPSHAVARCFGAPGDVDRLWEVPMEARTERGDADTALFGVARGATNLIDQGLDQVEPFPTEETRIRVYLFLPQILRFPPANLNHSIIDAREVMDWILRVDLREDAPTTVTLSWDASNARAADPPVTLQLIHGTRAVNMLNTTAYAFEAEPGINEFTIVAEEVEGDPLLLLALVLGGYGAAVGAYLVWRRRRRDREGGVKGSRDTSP